MADSFNKKDREKKRKKRQEDKAEKMEQRKSDGKKGNDIMYVDEFGNLTSSPPDPRHKIKIRKEDIDVSVPKKEALESVETVRNGFVKFFNSEKGYGFIVDDITGESYFTHVNNLIDEVAEQDRVSFEIGSGPKGPIALDVRLKGGN